MIHFCDVSKRVTDDRNGARFLLRDVTVSLPRNAQIALIGEDRQALTTTLHLLAGSEVPDQGRIIVDRLRRSPIINAGNVAGGSLVGRLSGLDNVKFYARIHGIDPGHLLAIVESVCRLDKLLSIPIREYERRRRQALEITLIAALPYDCYFLDNLDQFERPLVWHLVHAVRGRGAGLFFTTKKMPRLVQIGAIVEHGTIRIFHRSTKAVTDNEQGRRRRRP
jgi:capsular polysaccharide transport system ATP-binding protein